jgi:hypothetical protein
VILLLSLPVLSALGQRSKLAGYALILQYRVSVSVGKGIRAVQVTLEVAVLS